MSQRQFIATVESMATEFGQPVVVFVENPGGYPVSDQPADVFDTLKQALHSGQQVRVTCDSQTREIVDAVLDGR